MTDTLSHLWQAPIVQMTGLLLLSVLLGGLVGLERERNERPAGLRTHILVCLGSTIITLVSNSTPDNGGRIAAQIVTGVGFLGAGTIMRSMEDDRVRGLTTAASIWTIAGIGIAVGYGGVYAQMATVGTGIVLFTLTFINRAEDLLNRRRSRQELNIVLSNSVGMLGKIAHLQEEFKKLRVKTRDLQFTPAGDNHIIRMQISLPHNCRRAAIEKILTDDPEVAHFDWNE